MSSNAIQIDTIAKVVGYLLRTEDFAPQSPNLPQRIALIGEANTANQADLSTDPVQITSQKQAATLFGYGSPLHIMTRILLPQRSAGVGTLPIIAYPQAQAPGATSKILKVTVTGTATGNGTHKLVIAGRKGIDGLNYNIAIATGDNAATIHDKIEDAVNAVLGSPMTALSYGYDVRMESKWKGLTANDLNITIDTNDNDLGLTYAVANQQTAAGTPSVDASLELFGNNWNTIVVNSYGLVSSVLDSLESYNGIPDNETPTGRFQPTVFKPFIALTGSVAEDPSAITDARKNQVTIAVCPAPLSAGLPMEAAANVCVLLARQAQDNPHLDVSGMSYPDMPVPSVIGAMADFTSRNSIVSKGCSTVILESEKYKIEDFVSTYHPEGEAIPQFRYVRSLVIDYNTRFTYLVSEQLYVIDHVIANDTDIVDAVKVIKPKQWKQIVSGLAEQFVSRGLHVDADFMKESIQVSINSSNPDRLDTLFKYKRSAFGRQSSTDVTAGFNFGV